jgi:hypothetical protein
MLTSQYKSEVWQNLFKGLAHWRGITFRNKFMKTFVKIPLSDWLDMQFEVPVAPGNLHPRTRNRLSDAADISRSLPRLEKKGAAITLRRP